jgi:two-component system CitB family sensor kinase
LWSLVPGLVGYLALALAVGVAAAYLLARRLKRQTFGLELDEIAHLLQEREATLHGIREGVIAFDADGRVTVVNDEAQRLLGLPVGAVGDRLEERIPEGRLREVLTDDSTRPDDIVFTDDHCLIVNRMPVCLAGTSHGAVVTLRDRTEITGLLRELDGARGLTDSLRAQQHEFANRMHAVAGMLELGMPDDALQFVLEVQGTAVDFDNTLRTHIGAHQIVGLLLGKGAEASEHGIELVIDPRTRLGEAPEKVQALTTILGNLIDNAFDALASVPPPRRVTVAVVEDDDEVSVVVSDNGPGVPSGSRELVLQDGYSTKSSTPGRARGLGLALVHRQVTRMGGSIEVAEGPGACFSVRLPRRTAPGALARADGQL